MTLCHSWIHVCQVSKFRIWRYPIMSCLHVNLIICQIQHLILELLSLSTCVNITGGPDLRIADDHWSEWVTNQGPGQRTSDQSQAGIRGSEKFPPMPVWQANSSCHKAADREACQCHQYFLQSSISENLTNFTEPNLSDDVSHNKRVKSDQQWKCPSFKVCTTL